MRGKNMRSTQLPKKVQQYITVICTQKITQIQILTNTKIQMKIYKYVKSAINTHHTELPALQRKSKNYIAFIHP